jgi:GTP-binding protein
MFVDRVRIHAKAGAGGAGVAGFRRQRGRPRGKPTGGNGGAGGAVIVAATPDVPTLLRYANRPHWSAGDGTHGEGDLRHGRAGDDLVLPVPLGTLVRAEDGTVLADLVEPDQQLVIARGGRGGRGNAALVSRRRRVPGFAEQGEFGEETWITLELKLMADAALVGYPNAGKSTLVSRVSSAKPKIADYPFTTLVPTLGVVGVGDRELVLADVPGLIEGAADGKGLGHEFLRHVERARALVLMLDPTSLQEDPPDRQLDVLLGELHRHLAELSTRPHLVVLNKVDAIEDRARHLSWAAARGIELHLVSAVTGEGVEPLMHAIANLVDMAEAAAPEREGFVLHRPLPGGFSVTREGDGWVVKGLAAERAVNLDDLTVPEAADFAATRLARLGVDEALRAAGAEPGDDVRIGDLVFTFDPEEPA